MNKLINFVIVFCLFIVSCKNKVKNIEVFPTNKFILFYDELKDVEHLEPNAGFVFEIINNQNKKIVLDSLRIKGVVDYADEGLLNAIFIQKKSSFNIFRDSLIIPPKDKKKILIGIQGTGITIEDVKKRLSVCWINKAQFFFHTNQGNVKIEKSIKPFYEMSDDKYIYFVDGKLMHNKFVENKYKNFEFY